MYPTDPIKSKLIDMNLRRLLQTVFLLLVLFSSCTPYKSIPYFQDIKRDSVLIEKVTNFTPLTIQPGDLLALHVTSLNHEADAVFNYNLERPNGNIGVTTDRVDQNVVVGYLVDADGDIHLPQVGPLNLRGQSIAQATKTVEAKLAEKTLSSPSVVLRITNFKVSVMGDVAHPGTFLSPTDRYTVLQALADAGDLNSTGIRNNVLLAR